ncbi:MAG TPA: hypothetical protein VMU51_02685 [Mycobacteriales bacterium]|nr:hypothetical protein [Mycobacteriales bacterium]
MSERAGEPGGTVDAELRRRFLAMSAELTAFSTLDLEGTGQAEAYLSLVVRVVGEDVLDELLDAYEQATGPAGPDRTRLLKRDLFSNEKLGPIARNIIKLWYVGVWYELPAEWVESFGALEHDGTFTASAAAYAVGLLWYAIGAHPPGARAPGYGSWVAPPEFPPIPDIPAIDDGGAAADRDALLATAGRPSAQ